MQIVALSVLFLLLFLSILSLAGCRTKTAKVKQLHDQYNDDYPVCAKDCLEEDNTETTRLLTGQNLITKQMADLEAKKKERGAPCKPRADRLAQLQGEILAAQQWRWKSAAKSSRLTGPMLPPITRTRGIVCRSFWSCRSPGSRRLPLCRGYVLFPTRFTPPPGVDAVCSCRRVDSATATCSASDCPAQPRAQYPLGGEC